MGWVHDTGYGPVYKHEGYAVAVQGDGREVSSPSTAEGREVRGWRAGCECGWRGPSYFDRVDWASPSGWAPEELEDSLMLPEWSEHLTAALPELAVHDAARESGLASQRLEHAVIIAKAAGASWAKIADAAGIKRQSAHERWQHLVKTAAEPAGGPAPNRPGLSHPSLRQLVDGSRVPAHPMSTADAVTLARHAKAALMHLSTAERIAVAAGIDVDGPSSSRGTDYELAALFGSAMDTLQELDAWAINNAIGNGGTHTTHAGTEHWCHRPGGTLPHDDIPAQS